MTPFCTHAHGTWVLVQHPVRMRLHDWTEDSKCGEFYCQWTWLSVGRGVEKGTAREGNLSLESGHPWQDSSPKLHHQAVPLKSSCFSLMSNHSLWCQAASPLYWLSSGVLMGTRWGVGWAGPWVVLEKATLKLENRDVSSHFGLWFQAFQLEGGALAGDPSSSAQNFPAFCPYQWYTSLYNRKGRYNIKTTKIVHSKANKHTKIYVLWRKNIWLQW